jgi:hypothetical protein
MVNCGMSRDLVRSVERKRSHRERCVIGRIGSAVRSSVRDMEIKRITSKRPSKFFFSHAKIYSLFLSRECGAREPQSSARDARLEEETGAPEIGKNLEVRRCCPGVPQVAFKAPT